ncbi:uncharacterized protein A4U43_C02F3050 [Asparagus officinalis]|uniref:HhH-GPD domain-containing protein n=1 Tax=Asparagus officinalis TaxID=4686 RepID=A0A5P1FFE4_ASPOF|nr:transcriptional activator DEMETER-like [Asparagus officinalis]XP_020252728.1 transcriptional activator DEMETER-like [Asparagus officinalis]ONK77095.1 uncharacterized protein A4U43_C02F3050 [Asparagus officinalis]
MDLGVGDEIAGDSVNKEKIKVKTPRSKKPKRKKYTPKVIREVTSVVRAPKTPAKSKEKTPAKRKYVRKKKNVEVSIQGTLASAALSEPDASVGDVEETDQYVILTPLSERGGVFGSIGEQDRSVKRKLDFDIEEEKAQVKEKDQHTILAPLSELDGIIGSIEEQDQSVKRKLGFDIGEERAQVVVNSEEKVWITYERRRRKKKEEKSLIKVEENILTYVRRKKKDLCSVIPLIGSEKKVHLDKINGNATNCRGRKRGYSLIENSTPGRNFPVKKRSRRNMVENSGWGSIQALQRVKEYCNSGINHLFFQEIHKKRRTAKFRSVKGRSLCECHNVGTIPVNCKKERTGKAKKHASNSGGWQIIEEIQKSNALFFIQERETSDCIPTLCEEKEEKGVVVQANIPCTEPLTPMKEPKCSFNKQNWSYGPQARIEALIAMQMKPKTRRYKKKEQVIFVNFKLRKPVSKKEVNDIVRKLSHLNINGNAQSGMAIVPYARGVGVMVPFAGRRKKKDQPRVHVDLDPDSNRVWELWNITGRIDDGSIDKQKWWEEERRVFSGRVLMLIARMRLILGDRSFSRWKGSVVDSVTGVFLTQNVSDYLSSSAFMSLAARFPLQLKSNNVTTNAEVRNRLLLTSGTEQINVIDESTSNHSSEITNLKIVSTTFQHQESEEETKAERTQHEVVIQTQIQNWGTHETYSDLKDGDMSNKVNPINETNSSLRNEEGTTQKGSDENLNDTSKGKKGKANIAKEKYDWDSLRKEVLQNGGNKERSEDTMDSLDYDALRCAEVSEIAEAIKERGQHFNLSKRIKEFLNRIYQDHGSLDLEWLRDVQPDKVKEYLLSIGGLGLKSVECVRLLSLHHVAFPVDTNVGRICVRLGWVPLQPLPESLQLHHLEIYPDLATIQKYLWPRLCKFDQETLYNLHYMLITFGKVFCTKSKPNCKACPMRGECKHFASANASSRLALPMPEETSSMSSSIVIASGRAHIPVSNQNSLLPQLEDHIHSEVGIVTGICEPIVEEPATPEPIIEEQESECFEPSEMDMEDFFSNDTDEIPTLHLVEEMKWNLKNYMQGNSMGLQDGELSRALVAITPETASLPLPKLKNVGRLRTEHQAYVLPDGHALLEGMDKREPDDPCPYLLAIWTPGETAQSIEPPKSCCSCEDGKLCYNVTCHSCNSIREAQAQTVRGTILIPSRTANRGRFPLNGTYFQVNEVFADHYTSYNPIHVPTKLIWHLGRRTVYFGSSVTSICKGLTTEEIQYCFRLGYICHRGYDRDTRRPRPLCRRLHTPEGIVRAKDDGSIKTGKGKRSTPQKKKTKQQR